MDKDERNRYEQRFFDHHDEAARSIRELSDGVRRLMAAREPFTDEERG